MSVHVLQIPKSLKPRNALLPTTPGIQHVLKPFTLNPQYIDTQTTNFVN